MWQPIETGQVMELGFFFTAAKNWRLYMSHRKGANSRLEIGGDQLPPFLAAKNLEPYISQELIERTKLIKYECGGS